MFRYLDTFSLEITKEPLSSHDLASFCDVGTLRLSGNGEIKTFPIAEPFLNLRKLDLAGLGLEKLPRDFGHYAINLRELNLAFNRISDLTPLQAIPKLAHVFMYKNNIDSIATCLDLVKGSECLQLIDLRENPLTSGFYPDLNVTLHDWSLLKNDKSKESMFKRYMNSLSKTFQEHWVESDSSHASKIENYDGERFNKRIMYQGLLVSAAPGLKWLDGTILSPEIVGSIKKHWEFLINNRKMPN